MFGQPEDDHVFDIGLVHGVLRPCIVRGCRGRVDVYRPSFKFGERLRCSGGVQDWNGLAQVGE